MTMRKRYDIRDKMAYWGLLDPTNEVVEDICRKIPSRTPSAYEVSEIERLSTLFFPPNLICRALQISEEILSQWVQSDAEVRRALSKGSTEALKQVNGRLMEQVSKGNMSAIQFVLEGYYGINQKKPEELNTQTFKQEFHFHSLNAEERKKLLEKEFQIYDVIDQVNEQSSRVIPATLEREESPSE